MAWTGPVSYAPDRLGSSFYLVAWRTVATNLQRLVDNFHVDVCNLGSLNCAHVILLPKKGGFPDPGVFWHVSLQIRSIK